MGCRTGRVVGRALLSKPF
uniref:Uncharacterized protein n=1 Tax=Rhizophora mucronata TaxID=61149 RepID=A0A2P2N632_RHIMU